MRTLDRLKILYEERYREHHDIDRWNEAIEKEWPKILAVVEAARYVAGMIPEYGPDKSDMADLRDALRAMDES